MLSTNLTLGQWAILYICSTIIITPLIGYALRRAGRQCNTKTVIMTAIWPLSVPVGAYIFLVIVLLELLPYPLRRQNDGKSTQTH